MKNKKAETICPDCGAVCQGQRSLRSHYSQMHPRPYPWETESSPYKTEEWQQARRKALDRDSHSCTECGASDSSVRLDVHHVDKDNQNHQLSNLKTLCASCHQKVHQKTTHRRTAGSGD